MAKSWALNDRAQLHKTGIMSGSVQLQGPGIASQDISTYGKGSAREVPFALEVNAQHFAQVKTAVPKLRELISAAQRGESASVAEGPLDQLKKLGGLRDAGILTSAEFEAKKAEILSRL